jgi:tight adherence protein C
MGLFTSLYAPLQSQFGPLAPLMVIGGLGLVLILAVLPFLLIKKEDGFSKLKAQREGRDITAKTKVQENLLRRDEKNDKLKKFASFLEPQDAASFSAAQMRMLQAGYRSKNAVRLFHFAQLALGLGLLAAGMLYTLILSMQGAVTTQTMALATIGPAGAGYYLPQYWVTRRIQSRQTEITEGFPDALDLMLVCVEAGQSLDQSINRIAKEARAGYPALADEFDIIAQEVKAGKERTSVLKDMSTRVNVPDISSFVTTLVQSASFGTSIADALRMYSAEMRDKRVMKAEEAANKLPTKMTLGTMLFTLPPLLVILIGPSIHGIGKILGGG